MFRSIIKASQATYIDQRCGLCAILCSEFWRIYLIVRTIAMLFLNKSKMSIGAAAHARVQAAKWGADDWPLIRPGFQWIAMSDVSRCARTGTSFQLAKLYLNSSPVPGCVLTLCVFILIFSTLVHVTFVHLNVPEEVSFRGRSQNPV